ncbi:MAG: radical SAM protein [Acidobacteriota bacterium]
MTLDTRRIRALRPPKKAVDPGRPIAVLRELERWRGEAVPVEALTVFLAGAECPFTCVFCDLWRETLDDPTPPGAIPRQIHAAREEATAATRSIKLYNASNYFDERAVPAADDEAVLSAVRSFERVVVECHPRLTGARCLKFAAALERQDSRLEVAMGLETCDRQAFPKLNKGMDLEHFDQACERLLAAGCALRAFVLVGTPFVAPEDYVESAVATARHAFERGVDTVALIPLRAGNGAVDELIEAGDLRPPRLAELETALEGALAAAAEFSDDGTASPVITADTWDLDRFATCLHCAGGRTERLARINLSGAVELPVECDACSREGDSR